MPLDFSTFLPNLGLDQHAWAFLTFIFNLLVWFYWPLLGVQH